MRHDGLDVGLVGLGRLGRHYAEALSGSVPRARLRAVCTPDPVQRAWARSALGVEQVFEDYGDLLADPRLQAVFLVTPTALHADQIEQAVAAGKHVFCEKPLSLEPARCQQVIDRVGAAGPRVMVGFVRRFDSSYREAYGLIQAGHIGRPFLVQSQTADLRDDTGALLRFAPTSGGLFLDCSVHDIDVSRWLLGCPAARRVYAAGTVAVHAPLRDLDDVDNAVAICEFEGGALAAFHASRTQAHGHEARTEVSGTRGRLDIGRDPARSRLEIADAGGLRRRCHDDFHARFGPAFVVQCRHFIDAILDERPFELTLHDAREATRIAAAMRESQRAGQVVAL